MLTHRAWLLAVSLAAAPAVAAPAPGPSSHVLPFIPDDYPRALREARARKVPIFIEAWAPW
jgi:hypothetical protein